MAFSIRFDRLQDFLLGQDIYLDEPAMHDLSRRYTGTNGLAARSAPLKLSFTELEDLLTLARSMQHSCFKPISGTSGDNVHLRRSTATTPSTKYLQSAKAYDADAIRAAQTP